MMLLRANDQWRLGVSRTGVNDATYRGNKASADFDYVFINTNRADGGVKIGAVVEPQGDNISTLVYGSSSPWDKRENKNDNGFGGYPENTDKAIYIAANNCQLTLANNADIFEVSEPADGTPTFVSPKHRRTATKLSSAITKHYQQQRQPQEHSMFAPVVLLMQSPMHAPLAQQLN